MAVAETTWTFSAGAVPMRSVVPASKPLPVTVTDVPPSVLPVAGKTAEIAIRQGTIGLARQHSPGREQQTTHRHVSKRRSRHRIIFRLSSVSIKSRQVELYGANPRAPAAQILLSFMSPSGMLRA